MSLVRIACQQKNRLRKSYAPTSVVLDAIGKVLGIQRLRIMYPLTQDELHKINIYLKGIKVIAQRVSEEKMENRGSHKHAGGIDHVSFDTDRQRSQTYLCPRVLCESV
jgi:hypothetical protein